MSVGYQNTLLYIVVVVVVVDWLAVVFNRNSLRSIDPLLMAPTCLFLASKVEVLSYIVHSVCRHCLHPVFIVLTI